MLSIKGVSKSFKEVQAVNNISLDIGPGRIFGLLGANGAGKTTLFRMILNIITPDEGSITYNDKPLTIENSSLIGYLPEERSLYQREKVGNQVVYLAKIKGLTTKEAEKRLDFYLERFGITEYKNRKLRELSKGNQQKVALIVALIHDPEIVILDEPFSGLDPVNAKLFKDWIVEIARKGKTIIFSSHRMDVIEELCEEMALLKKGKIVLGGRLKEIKESYRKKNIFIQGENLTLDHFNNIPGINKVECVNDEFIVSLDDKEVIPDLIKALNEKVIITKFIQEEPTLDEIFIEKMGEKYEG
ncbi:MAG TPA: ATP-binding cassette domain-containing protein [Acholeplasmataceae bacterium]|nr:ATP-binding cassette domain-containing protein [Acholeplasmataceae bacterium]